MQYTEKSGAPTKPKVLEIKTAFPPPRFLNWGSTLRKYPLNVHLPGEVEILFRHIHEWLGGPDDGAADQDIESP